MKFCYSLTFLFFLSGCATIDQSKYPNVNFDENVIQNIDFHKYEKRSSSASLEKCVRKYVRNEAIETKDYNANHKLDGFFIDAIGKKRTYVKGEIPGGELILEMEPDRVKAAGNFIYAQHSLAPAALRFILEVSDTSTGVSYRYSKLNRFFYDFVGADPYFNITGWQNLPADTQHERFRWIYRVFSDYTNNIQYCLTSM
jgi:hypothetical protein